MQMGLSPALIESLLLEEESHVLDFKQGQYRFKRDSSPELTEKNRSELVKDLVAFANTERTQPAFILIGVKEVKGGRSEVIGITEHLIDDDLHDFMNKRTQRPVVFSYAPFEIRGREIGVIEIPVQNRPVFLTKDYGELHANLVYIRDGSATRTATPYEIQEMMSPTPTHIVVNWIDSFSSEIVPQDLTVRNKLLYPVLREDDVVLSPSPIRDPMSILGPRRNRNYPAKLIEYAFFENLCVPLGLRIYNKSRTTGKEICFEGTVAKRDGLTVLRRLPDFPKEFTDNLFVGSLTTDFTDPPRIQLLESDDSWDVFVEFGNVRPGEAVLTRNHLLFGLSSSGIMQMKGRIIGENIPEPLECSLDVRFTTENRPMTPDDIFYDTNSQT